MLNFINYNGQIILASEVILGVNNRAFKYGDSLFETIRMFDGVLPFLPLHVDRLQAGMKMLGMQPPASFNAQFIEQEIRRLVPSDDYRIRLTVFRNDGGLYTPQDNGIQFVIEASHLIESTFQLNEEGLQVGIAAQQHLTVSPYSHLKTGNSLPYIIAGLERKAKSWDNILLRNQAGEIAEGLTNNLFLILQDGRIITPPLSSGCVGGTLRRYLLEYTDLDIKAESITPNTLEKAESIFLTNAIQGVQWVEQVGEQKFTCLSKIQDIVTLLQSPQV